MSFPKNERLSFFSCLPQAGQHNAESLTSFWHTKHFDFIRFFVVDKCQLINWFRVIHIER